MVLNEIISCDKTLVVLEKLKRMLGRLKTCERHNLAGSCIPSRTLLVFKNKKSTPCNRMHMLCMSSLHVCVQSQWWVLIFSRAAVPIWARNVIGPAENKTVLEVDDDSGNAVSQNVAGTNVNSYSMHRSWLLRFNLCNAEGRTSHFPI